MNDPQERESVFRGTGLEFLEDELNEIAADTSVAKRELAETDRQRKDAVTAAEEPFLQPIKDARARIAELEASADMERVAEKIQGADLDELSLTALDIILRKHNSTLLDFSEGIREVAQLTPSTSRFRVDGTRRLLTEFAGFRAMDRALKKPIIFEREGTIPVGLFTVEWVEETDGQAEWEGRDARTGIFKKRVDALVGQANWRGLSVVRRNVAPEQLVPVLEPASIVLGVPEAAVVRPFSDWGEEKSELKEATDQQIELVSAPLEDERKLRGVPDIQWDKALKDKFPLLDSQSRPAHRGFEKARYIAWGTSLVALVAKLAQDQSVPASTRQNFAKIQESLRT